MASYPIHASSKGIIFDIAGLGAEKVLPAGIKRAEQKLDAKTADHEERIEIIEEHLRLPHKN